MVERILSFAATIAVRWVLLSVICLIGWSILVRYVFNREP